MSGDGLLAHRVEGEGEPLLLLNGGLMTYAAWQPVADRLRRHHRLVLCDLRGQLLSPGPAPRELADNVADLTALLDRLGIGSAHVLGTSYGGSVALLLAALAPERVRSLVAVTVADHSDPVMRRRGEELRALLAAATDVPGRRRFHEHLSTLVYSAAYQERSADELAARRTQVAALPGAWFAQLDGILSAVATLDLRPHLAAIRAPTLVVVAGEDRLIPAERSLALAAAIAGAETRIHETSGHALVAEDPAWLAGVSLEFLARHARAAAAESPPT